jgi:hypothetical protein
MVAHGGASGFADPNRVGERLIAVEIEKAEQDRRACGWAQKCFCDQGETFSKSNNGKRKRKIFTLEVRHEHE